MKLPLLKTATVRQFPKAVIASMRFQVGFNHSRPAVVAMYDRMRFLGYRTTSDTMLVFHLCGHGRTLAAACADAGITTAEVSPENCQTF